MKKHAILHAEQFWLDAPQPGGGSLFRQYMDRDIGYIWIVI
jgi:hypothetical protein